MNKKKIYRSTVNGLRSTVIAGLLSLTLAFMLTSCSNDDSISTGNNQISGTPISFTTSYEEASTRASIANLSTLQANGFYVYANATNGESEIKEKFMNKQLVNWNTNITPYAWTYSPEKLWPTNKNAIVDFYAVYTDGSENINTQYDWYNKPQTIFSVNEIVSKQTDMLWAAPQLNINAQYYASHNTPVHFQFQHALAGFKFTIKLKEQTPATYYDGYTITVNSLKLKGYFAPRAQVMPDETTLGRAYKLEGDWIERTYTISKNGDTEVNPEVSGTGTTAPYITTTAKDLTGEKGYIMVLPFGQQYTVELEYTVDGPQGTGIHTASQNVTSTNLVAGNMLNTLIILNPNLDPTPGGGEGDIDLKVTLIDWKDVNAGSLDIRFD